MKLVWTRQHVVIAIVALFIIIGLFTWMVMRIVTPVQAERVAVEHEMMSEHQLLQTLKQETGEEKLSRMRSSIHLQQRLPVKPFIDQLLLDLLRVEGISNTYILSINIEEDQDESIYFDATDEEMNTNETTQESNPNVVDGEEMPTTITGYESSRFILTIKAQNYEEITHFIEEIEKLNRIINIESISYAGPKEQIFIDDELDSLEFTIVVSAFYFPEVVELEGEFPMIEFPKQEQKQTPFYQE